MIAAVHTLVCADDLHAARPPFRAVAPGAGELLPHQPQHPKVHDL